MKFFQFKSQKYLCACIVSLSIIAGCVKRTECDPLTLTSINIIDRNGLTEMINSPERLKQYQTVDFLKPQPYQKVTRVFNRDEQGNSFSHITCYHPNGQPKQYLESVNGRAYGIYKEWHSNGTLSLQTFVIGGVADLNTAAEKSWLFDGCSSAWDENGNLLAEIEYEKGELQGVSKHYHPNGKIWKQASYANNQIEGSYEIFTDCGELLQTTAYCGGVKNGPSLRFWPGAIVAAEETYKDGMLNEGSYFNMDGELVAEIHSGTGYRASFSKTAISELQEYRNGVVDGEVKVYDKDSNIIKIYHVKNGVKHGEEIEYYEQTPLQPELQTRLLISWYEGKIQGMVRTWYPSGIMESQREMSNNYKNGLLTAWYQDGNLMMIEEYDREKLMRGEYYKKGEKSPISQVMGGNGVVTLFDSEGNYLRRINIYCGRPQDIK